MEDVMLSAAEEETVTQTGLTQPTNPNNQLTNQPVTESANYLPI